MSLPGRIHPVERSAAETTVQWKGSGPLEAYGGSAAFTSLRVVLPQLEAADQAEASINQKRYYRCIRRRSR